MTARLAARNNPSLFAMSYDRDRIGVTDLIVVPRHFFTQDIIQARKPLGPNARRAGWQGCNILIGQVPLSGRIPLITRGSHVSKGEVLDRWRATLFLKDASLTARGCLLAVMKAVEAIGSRSSPWTRSMPTKRPWPRSIPATTMSGPRSGSSCRCCATGAGWPSTGAVPIGGPPKLTRTCPHNSSSVFSHSSIVTLPRKGPK